MLYNFNFHACDLTKRTLALATIIDIDDYLTCHLPLRPQMNEVKVFKDQIAQHGFIGYLIYLPLNGGRHQTPM